MSTVHRFAGVVLDLDLGTIGYQSDLHRDVRGATAQVETAGDIDRRVTATRLMLTGPLAFGLRKKKDQRELWLTIEGGDFAWAVPVKPKKSADARRFAALIHSASKQERPETQELPPTLAPPQRGGPTASSTGEQTIGVADEIRKLNQLRDDGLISAEEFKQLRANLIQSATEEAADENVASSDEADRDEELLRHDRDALETPWPVRKSLFKEYQRKNRDIARLGGKSLSLLDDLSEDFIRQLPSELVEIVGSYSTGGHSTDYLVPYKPVDVAAAIERLQVAGLLDDQQRSRVRLRLAWTNPVFEDHP